VNGSNRKTWYSFASFEVEGNWNKLTKKFCEKFFPISKVQYLRRQVTKLGIDLMS
jgi:hypothetical protein